MEAQTSVPQTATVETSPVESTKKLLLEWEAPARPFKKRDKDFFTSISIIAFLTVVILFFMREWFPILVILATLFLAWVLATVPPENIKNSIYTTGLQYGLFFYDYSHLLSYWYEDKAGQKMLVARTRDRLPGAIYLLLNDQTEAHIDELIAGNLPKKSVPEITWMDNAAVWLASKLSLDKRS